MAKTLRLKTKQEDLVFWFILILPATLITTIFILIPIIDSILKSFLDFKMINVIQKIPAQWNYFLNYQTLWERGILPKSVFITFLFVVSVVSAQLILGMTLALLLNSGLPGSRFLRSIMMIPWVIPTVISALLWMWIFQPEYGLFRYLINFFSGGAIPDFAILNRTSSALQGVEIAALWKQIPLMTLLLLAGLQGVPEDTLEAAKIDGANTAVRLFKIIIPHMKSVIKIAVVMSIIENFKQFPLFWTMTGGGPNGATTTLAVLSYQEAFIDFNLGSGAAVTTVWMLLMIIVVFIYNKIFKTDD